MSSIYHYQSQISSAESEISSEKSEIRSLEAEISRLRAQRSVVSGEISDVQRRLDLQNSEITATRRIICQHDGKINNVNAEMGDSTSQIREKIRSASDEIQQEQMSGRSDMKTLDIGYGMSASDIEKAVLDEWAENSQRIASLQQSISEESGLQLARQESILEMSRYLGGIQDEHTVRGIVANLTGKLNLKSQLPSEILLNYLDGFAVRCRQIREESFVEGKVSIAGNSSLFITDYHSITDINAFRQTLLDAGLEVEIADNYLDNQAIRDNGILTDVELIRKESTLLSRGLDARAARIYTLLAINHDWEIANKSDFHMIEYLDYKFFNDAKAFVDKINTTDTTKSKQIRKLLEELAVDEKGIILDSASEINKTIYSQVDEDLQKYLFFSKKLDERDSIITEHKKIRAQIGDRAKSLREEMAQIRQTLSTQLTYRLPDPLGRLSGVVTLADASAYASQLEKDIELANQDMLRSAAKQKELENNLAIETSPAGATDFLHAESALEQYLGRLIENYDSLSEDEKRLRPEILEKIQQADTYIDQLRLKISDLAKQKRDYEAERDVSAGILNRQQEIANQYQKEINSIQLRKLSPIDSEISRKETEIDNLESSIHSHSADISSWKSAIYRIKQDEESSSSYGSSSSSYSGGGSSFSSHSGGGSSFSSHSGGGSSFTGRR